MKYAFAASMILGAAAVVAIGVCGSQRHYCSQNDCITALVWIGIYCAAGIRYQALLPTIPQTLIGRLLLMATAPLAIAWVAGQVNWYRPPTWADLSGYAALISAASSLWWPAVGRPLAFAGNRIVSWVRTGR